MISASDSIVFAGKAQAFAGPGADLRKYPLLAHAPQQWGEGVRVASNGEPVAEVARSARCTEGSVVTGLDLVAEDHGITFAELLDSLRYCRDHRMI